MRASCSFLLCLLLLAAFASSVSAQPGLYAFCFTSVNTLQTSPHLPWAVSMSGTLNLTGSLTYGNFQWYIQGYFASSLWQQGYLVSSAIGTRTIYQQGNAANTIQITGIAPVNAYNGNDNILATSAPYFDTVAHGLTFLTSAQPTFAMGTVNNQGLIQGNPQYVNINNFTFPLAYGAGVMESDNPPNDGDSDTITSTFTLTPTTTWSASVSCPSITPPTVSAALMTAFQSSLQWSFCYTVSGGGDGIAMGGVWTISVTGTLTTTAYQGTTLSGRAAYMATGVTGARSYVNPGTGVTSNVTLYALGGVNAQQATAYYEEQFDFLYSYYGLFTDVSNNVFYPQYPYFDNFGLNVVTNGWIADEYWNNATSTIVRVWVEPRTWSFDELVFDPNWGWGWSTDGAIIATTVSNATSMGLSAFNAQCSPTAGPLQTFQFCYWIDGTTQPTPYFLQVYGNFHATGPVPRQGRNAYNLQDMGGVRVFTNTATGAVNATGIIYLYWNEALESYENDNLVYTTMPYIDQLGLIYQTTPNGNSMYFPQGTAQAQPILMASTQVGGVTAGAYLYESNLYNSSQTTLQATAPTFAFNYQVATGAPSQSLCASTSKWVQPITTLTWSYCYVMQGADNGGWQTTVSGVLTTYTQPIWMSGLLAYQVQNASGTRTFQNQTSRSSTQIVGISNNAQGQYGWYYDNVLYAQPPYLDPDGLLLHFTGTAWTATGPISGDGANVINMFYWYAYQEEWYSNQQYSVYGDVVGNFGLVQDNGAAAAAGTVLQSQCGVTPGSTFANTYATYAFCYTIQNTMSTSPYLPFIVQASGTWTIVSNSNTTGWLQQTVEYPGSLVVSLTGTRTVYVQGKAAQTQQLTLAPIQSYLANDNIVQASPPYFVSYHALVMQTTGGPPIYAAGPILNGTGTVNYIALTSLISPLPYGTGQFSEADLPLNDNETAIITSSITVTPGSQWTCPSISNPVTATAASAYAATITYNFCYTYAKSDGLVPGTNRTVVFTGTLTVAGYVGTTLSGRSASVVLSATGVRSITLGNGSTTSTTINGVGGVNAYQYVQENFNYLQYGSFFATNNILYSSYPYFDIYGLALNGATAFSEGSIWENAIASQGSTYDTALKLFIDPTDYSLQEWILDWSVNAYYVGEAGNMQLAPSSQVASGSTFNAQCSSDYGTQQNYNFCYWIRGPNYFDYAYGTFWAKGPVTRQGRTAYSVQTMNGVRTYLNLSTGMSSSNNIIDLQYMFQDYSYGGGSQGTDGLTYWTINDNIVYTQPPYLDMQGLIYHTFSTPNLPMYPSGMGNTNDVLVAANQTWGQLAGDAVFESAITTGNSMTTTGNSMFMYSQGSLSSSSQCSGTNPNFVYPPLLTYSFCYVLTGGNATTYNFTVSSSGTFTVYQTPLSSTLQYPSATAYPVAAVSGYRLYTDNLGNNSYVTITGLGASYQATVGWDYDQLYYLNNQSWDVYGLLYEFSGTAMSPSGPVFGDLNSPVINIFSDGVNFQEEGWYGQFSGAYDIFGVFNASQDGGASYNSGGLLRQACGYSGPIPAGFGPNANQNNGGGGGSGLSNGAIAGIVIGSVVGGLLLLICCLFVLLGARRGKGDKKQQPETSTVGAGTSAQYATQEDSRVETSRVEMVPA
jgi:hypothetical protein